MRYRNLPADKIRSLARASDGFAERSAMLGDLMRLIGLSASAQFGVRPRLTGKMLDQLFATCDKVIRCLIGKPQDCPMPAHGTI